MSPNFQIAWRFIISRKRSMAMSLAGIMFGVGFFIITQAQTSGFEKFYIETIIGTDSHIRIEDRFQNVGTKMQGLGAGGLSSFIAQSENIKKYVQGIEYPERLKKAIESFEDVTVVSEVLRGSATALSSFSEEPIRMQGIRVEDHMKVTKMADHLQLGSLDNFRLNSNSVLIGDNLAFRLNVTVGDSITIETSKETQRFSVAGIFSTGVTTIDKRRVFLHISAARSILHKPFGGAFFQIALKDHERAKEVASHMEAVLRHNVLSWQEREKTWLEVFRALKVSSAITVSSIILISGLGMFNTLAMIVMEKTKEIAILRSMGYTRRDIGRIFLWQGSIIFFAGTVLGWAFGAGSTYGISRLPIRIRGIFSTDTFIVNWDLSHYIWATVIAAVVVYIASYIPSKRAASIVPGDIIRGTSG